MSQQGDSQETNHTQLEYPANTPRQPNTQANGSLSPVTPRQSGGPFSPQFTLSQGNYPSNFYPLARWCRPKQHGRNCTQSS
jgi:hypothetical protein